MPAASGLDALIRRFPDRAARLRQLYPADDEFRAICEDYGDALRALAHWSHADQSFAAARVEEYREIAQELEAEVLAALDARAGG